MSIIKGKPAVCQMCGREFYRNSGNVNRFCGRRCANKYREQYGFFPKKEGGRREGKVVPVCPIPVFVDYMPRVGQVYEAELYKLMGRNDGWNAVVRVKDKKILLRAGEFREIEKGP